jgi:uncharacterized membrane protein
MTFLAAGLALFVAVHLIPAIPALRALLVERLGEGAYRGAFALAALAGLVMAGWGFPPASSEPVYAPPGWGRGAALVAVPVALALFAAACLPTRLRAVLRHPMLLGLLLWALAHLAANGEVRSVALFGGLAAYAIVAIASAEMRGRRPAAGRAPRLAMDAAAAVAGLVAAGLLVRFHAALFGVPAM